MHDKTDDMSVNGRIALMEKIKDLPREQNPGSPPIEGKRYSEAELIQEGISAGMPPEMMQDILAFLNQDAAIFFFDRDSLSDTTIDVTFIRKH